MASYTFFHDEKPQKGLEIEHSSRFPHRHKATNPDRTHWI